jgi:hypothetical protein
MAIYCHPASLSSAGSKNKRIQAIGLVYGAWESRYSAAGAGGPAVITADFVNRY